MFITEIKRRNTIPATIIVSIIYLESFRYFSVFFKIVRKLFIQTIYHVEISPNSFKNRGAIKTLRLAHPYMIIVHKLAKVGCDCTFFHGVTVGIIENNREVKAPNIGDNVYVGCNASIIGDVKIGNNVKIGAHTLVLKNIIDNETIVGIYK